MALTRTQQIELVSLLRQRFAALDAHGDTSAETTAWTRQFITDRLPDATQEALYDELLLGLIAEQEVKRDESSTHFSDVLDVLQDKTRV